MPSNAMKNRDPNQKPPPLRGPSHTGFWAFSGRPLTEDDVVNLKRRGVILPDKPFEPNDPTYDSSTVDVMPDNRLKLPKFRIGWGRSIKAGDIQPPSVAPEELEVRQERRWRAYRRLSEPRPDYFEWAAAYSRRQEYDDLESIARNAPKINDRIKAKELLLRYGKAMPKQQVELTSKPEAREPLDPIRLLNLALEMNGIPHDKFDEFVKTVRS